MRYSYVLLILIFIINACTTVTLQRKKVQDISYRELLLQNEFWQESIASMDGNARITLDTPEYSGNFTSDILMEGNDSLLITLTGPMGIRMGKVFIAKNRFVFYNQVMNQFMTGDRQDFEDTNFLQFPLELTQLRSVFAAQECFGILKKNKFEIQDDAFYVETINGTLSYHIWFDRRHLRIKKIEYYDGSQLLLYKEYKRFEEINGVLFPRVINFVRPAEKQGFSIFYTNLEINKPLKKERFVIHISDNAKQIDLSLER